MIASIFNKCIFEFLETAKNIINAIIAIIMKRTVNTIWYFFLKYLPILTTVSDFSSFKFTWTIPTLVVRGVTGSEEVFVLDKRSAPVIKCCVDTGIRKSNILSISSNFATSQVGNC